LQPGGRRRGVGHPVQVRHRLHRVQPIRTRRPAEGLQRQGLTQGGFLLGLLARFVSGLGPAV
jgi:hypothetical protein